MNTRSFLLAALIGGAIMGFLGNIPILNFINCFLCAWVWLSGILAVYLYRRFELANPALSVGQGLALGAVAGVIGAIIGAIVGAIFGGLGAAALVSSLRNMPGYDPSSMDTFTNLIAGGGFSLISLSCNLVLYALFGAIGGLIGTALIWKAPAALPPAPPAPPMQ
jgi:hypothetical protein